MATNFLELAITLKDLGAKWLLGKKVNFRPWLTVMASNRTIHKKITSFIKDRTILKK